MSTGKFDRTEFLDRLRDAASKGAVTLVTRATTSATATPAPTTLVAAHLGDHWLDSATFWFDAELNPASVTAETVKVVDKATGEIHPVTIGLAGGNTVVVQPTEPMKNRGEYDFILSEGIRDGSGRPVLPSTFHAIRM